MTTADKHHAKPNPMGIGSRGQYCAKATTPKFEVAAIGMRADLQAGRGDFPIELQFQLCGACWHLVKANGPISRV